MAKKQSANPKNDAAKTTKRPVAMIPKDDVPVFYVNAVNFELSTWDVKMRMGQIDSADESLLRVAEHVRIFMSYSHARAFAQALNRLVEQIDRAERAGATTSIASSKAH